MGLMRHEHRLVNKMHYESLGDDPAEDSATNIIVCSYCNCEHMVTLCVCVCAHVHGISDLPEREDGEGEETPIFSHWGPPRRFVLFFLGQ